MFTSKTQKSNRQPAVASEVLTSDQLELVVGGNMLPPGGGIPWGGPGTDLGGLGRRPLFPNPGLT